LNPVQTFSCHGELLCRGSVYRKPEAGDGAGIDIVC
jgi:hypothetical protein